MIEWDVTIDEIPVSGMGKEVTVNFKCYEIENSESFFTDSNGFQMQERRLNYRPQWMFSASSH